MCNLYYKEIQNLLQKRQGQMNSTSECASIAEQLNCFTLEHPVYGSLDSSLLIADNTHHVYKFEQKNKTVESKSHIQNSIDIDDLSNYIPLQTIPKQGQIVSTFHMNINKQISKCQSSVLNIDGEDLQLIIVLTQQSIMLWFRFIIHFHPSQEDLLYKLADLSNLQAIGNVSDYYLSVNQVSKQVCLDILTTPNKYNQKLNLDLHNFIFHIQIQKQNIKKLILRKKSENKKIPLHLCGTQYTVQDCPPIKFLNEGKIIALGNYITQVNEQFHANLEGVSEIVHFQYGKNYLIYADLINLYLYDRKQLTSQAVAIEENKDIIFLKFLTIDVSFALTTISPARVDVYNINRQILWSISLSHIQKPLVINNFAKQNGLILVLLDINKMITYKISNKSLISSAPKLTFPPQQIKVHESTTTTLKHRMQILKTLQTYLKNEDFNSVFRFLNNCNNNSLLNDGLMIVHNRMALDRANIGYEGQLMLIGNMLLQQSKYESHIQNSLQVLLQSCKRLREVGVHESKQWKECMRLLKTVIESKKVRKLQQQQKNKRIFELAYELLHTANSHLLKTNPF